MSWSNSLTFISHLQKPETTAKNAEKHPEATSQNGAKPVEVTAQNGTKEPEAITEPPAADKNGGQGGSDDKANNKADPAVGPNGDPDFTPEQDTKLLEMKADGKSTWKQIAAELSKPPHELKKRFKELKAGDNAGGGGNGGNKEEDGGHGKAGEGGGHKEEDGGNGLGGREGEGSKEKQGDGKNGGGGSAVDEGSFKKEKGNKEKKDANVKKNKVERHDGAEPAFTLPQWRDLAQDDLFSLEELQILWNLVKKDKEKEWLRIASGFYDKTGRRVHGDDIRERFAELKIS